MDAIEHGDWRMRRTYQRPDGCWLWEFAENWHLNDDPHDPDNWVSVGHALDSASRADLARVAAEAAGLPIPGEGEVVVSTERLRLLGLEFPGLCRLPECEACAEDYTRWLQRLTAGQGEGENDGN